MVCFSGCNSEDFKDFVYGVAIVLYDYYNLGDSQDIQGQTFYGSGDTGSNVN
jgi:hypothetical protein